MSDNKKNPFVPISKTWRGLLIGYVLLYEIFTPALGEILHGTGAPLVGGRLTLDLVYQLLVFLPLFFYRSKKYGWLHPLLYPTFFAIGKSFVKDPSQLLAPLRLFQEGQSEILLHPELPQYGTDAMAWASLELQAYSVLGILCYYAGFFFAERFTKFDLKPSFVKFQAVKRVKVVVFAVMAVAVVVFLRFIQQYGGLDAYMLSYFGGNRLELRGEAGGTIFFAVGIGSIACLLWYAVDVNAIKNPLFWASAAFFVPVEFFLTGSRSAVFITAALFLTVWMLRHQKVPKGRIAGFAVLTILLVGIMGEFRTSAKSGRMNWEIFTSTSAGAAISETREQVRARNLVGGATPVFAAVPDDVGYLYGKSYIGATFFFIPRLIWNDKPEGGGYYNRELILKRESGGAVPVGEVGEAYWNFALPGVVIVFFVFGMFHKGLVRLLCRNVHHPIVWSLYILAIVKLKPSSVPMTTGLRDLMGAIFIAMLMGAFSIHFRKSKSAKA